MSEHIPDEPEIPDESDFKLLKPEQRSEVYDLLGQAADAEAAEGADALAAGSSNTTGEPDGGKASETAERFRDRAVDLIESRAGPETGRRVLSEIEMRMPEFDAQEHQEGDLSTRDPANTPPSVSVPEALSARAREKAAGNLRDARRIESGELEGDRDLAEALRGEVADMLREEGVTADALAAESQQAQGDINDIGQVADRLGGVKIRTQPNVGPEPAVKILENAGYAVEVSDNAHSQDVEFLVSTVIGDRSAEQVASLLNEKMTDAEAKAADSGDESDDGDGDGGSGGGREQGGSSPDGLSADADALAAAPRGVMVRSDGLAGTQNALDTLESAGFTAGLEYGSNPDGNQLVVKSSNQKTADRAAQTLAEQTGVSIKSDTF